MRSKDWQPAWVVESRLPAFLGGEVQQDGYEKRGNMDHGCTLYVLLYLYRSEISVLTADSWGNTPAFDVVNLPSNEHDSSLDLALAFPGE